MKVTAKIRNSMGWILFIWAAWGGCTQHSTTEKYQNKRDNVVNVRDKVKEIPMEEVLIGPSVGMYLMDDYLLIAYSRSPDKLIHIFDKKEFSYITSLADRGQGPGEIANMGHIGIDEEHRMFYVSDHGKQAIFSYELDSVLVNPIYMPEVKIKMDKGLFPDRYQYLNDTLCYGRFIEPVGNADFRDGVCIFNMNTGEIKRIQGKHPDLDKNRIGIAASMENKIYVEYSHTYDLMAICNLNGDLKYTIYGPNWSKERDRKDHYGKVVFIKDKIFASYAKGNYQTNEYIPTQFLVFDIEGNYLQTIETGYWISDFCYDNDNHRIILCCNDAELQFAYFDLEGVIQ
jgi:hypothetical protein